MRRKKSNKSAIISDVSILSTTILRNNNNVNNNNVNNNAKGVVLHEMQPQHSIADILGASVIKTPFLRNISKESIRIFFVEYDEYVVQCPGGAIRNKH